MIVFLFLVLLQCSSNSNRGEVGSKVSFLKGKDKLNKDDKKKVLEMRDFEFGSISFMLKDASVERLRDLSSYILDRSENKMNLLSFLASKLKYVNDEKYESECTNLIANLMDKLDPLSNGVDLKGGFDPRDTIFYRDNMDRNFLYYATLIGSTELVKKSIDRFECLKELGAERNKIVSDANYRSFFTTPYATVEDMWKRKTPILYCHFLIQSPEVTKILMKQFGKDGYEHEGEGFLLWAFKNYEAGRAVGIIDYIYDQPLENREEIIDKVTKGDSENRLLEYGINCLTKNCSSGDSYERFISLIKNKENKDGKKFNGDTSSSLEDKSLSKKIKVLEEDGNKGITVPYPSDNWSNTNSEGSSTSLLSSCSKVEEIVGSLKNLESAV